MTKPFDVDRFYDQLRTTWVGSELIYIKKTDSTNSYVKRIPSDELVHGSVVLADHQTKGRGQYERKWEADPYKNLTFTVAFRPPKGDRLPLLTLGCASAVAGALEACTDDKIRIKWPNDLLVQNRKLGGLLTECTFNGSKPDRVLLGIGLNIHQKTFGKDVRDTAVSLASIANQPIRREDLLAGILFGIEEVYRKWYKSDISLLREINSRLIGYGEWVQLSIHQKIQKEKYKFIGVNEKGELLMLNEQLDVNKFSYEQIRIITGNPQVSKTTKNLSV